MEDKIILGLDIGISSVGWAVLNENTKEIIESGVRLFESGDASKNQERRAFRESKRVTRRRKHRLERLTDFMEEYDFFKPTNINLSPLELRNKGLTERLEKDEIFVCLYNIAKHRGVAYLEDIEEAKTNSDLVNGIEKAKAEGLIYPCQIQKKRYCEYGLYRGTHVIDGESFMNTFTIGMYEAEARKILEEQGKYYAEINDEFINKYIAILKAKREYYIGPGNKLSRTNYGVFKTSGETKDNLFDELRGKCSIYNGKNGMDSELRASGASYTAQYYNLLNDLCNIKVDGEKLSKEQKLEVIELIKNKKDAIKITKALKELYKIKPETVSGYRIDKDEKEENHSFEVYRKMRFFLTEYNIEIDKFSIETLDAIGDILTLNTETEAILKFFGNTERTEYEHIKNLNETEINALIDFRRKKGSLFNKWSNFSYRLLKIVVPEMLESGDEQHTCITRMKIKKYEQVAKSKINYKDITEEIYNPVVVRSITQSTKIVNALIKKYEFKDVVIEMARDKNEKDARKNIKDMQKANEELRKKAIIASGIDESRLDFKGHKNLLLKLKLLYKQGGKCLYSGNTISIDKLLADQHNYEIDHIIPVSISFDDSQSNKVLVEAYHNSKKGNKTPFNYLSSSTETWNYSEYKNYILELYSKKLIAKKQKELLLFEEDITKVSVVQGFINRNLNDTRYSSRVVLNELQRFFRNNESETKVKVINGSMTNQFRKNILDYDKDRDLDYRHHAEDAAICCYAMTSLKKFSGEYIDLNTGEIINKEIMLENRKNNDIAEYMTLSGWEARNELKKARDKIKFSHKVDRKINRGVSNQTIYSTRTIDDDTYVVNKISDLYNDDKAKEKILSKEKDFLMYKHDLKTWNIIKKVIETYPEEKNPFKKYLEEYGPIRKYSKKGKGPIIKELKYLNNKIGAHIEITHKYNDAKNKVILASLKPYRADIYYDKINDCFNVIPLKYNDFKFEKGKYVLPINQYEKILRQEKLIKDNENIKDLEKNNHEFRFSLYKNDVIEIGNDEGRELYRFLAKNHASKNVFEVKYLDRKNEKQIYITAKKSTNYFVKYNVDILGNIHKIQKEKLKLEFVLDNKMIKS